MRRLVPGLPVMLRVGSRLVLFVLICLLRFPGASQAAFELRPLPPAARGGATHLAQGRGVRASGRPEANSGAGLRELRVYGFKPFGLNEAAFVEASAELRLKHDLDLRLGYQALDVLSYAEQTCTVRLRWTAGRLRLEPGLRLGTVVVDQAVLDRALIVDIAGYARLSDGAEVYFGAHNPFALGLFRTDERCPVDIAAGLGYTVCRRLAFGVEASKEAGFPTSVATGIEVRLTDKIEVRSGARTGPKEFCFGLGLDLGRIALDISSSLHVDLGVTHEAGLTYRRR